MSDPMMGKGESTIDDLPVPSLVLSISPEPTRDERDAVVAALVVLTRDRGFDDAPTHRTLTPWQATARREGVEAGKRRHGWR